MFRIAHLSDFHFRGNREERKDKSFADYILESANLRDTAERLVRKLKAQSHSDDLKEKTSCLVKRLNAKNQLDLILISGDLAASGGRADLLEALAYVLTLKSND